MLIIMVLSGPTLCGGSLRRQICMAIAGRDQPVRTCRSVCYMGRTAPAPADRLILGLHGWDDGSTRRDVGPCACGVPGDLSWPFVLF